MKNFSTRVKEALANSKAFTELEKSQTKHDPQSALLVGAVIGFQLAMEEITNQ